MKIYCELNDENTRKAASIVMKHCIDEDFLMRVRNVSSFNHTDQSSEEVARRMIAIIPHLEVVIKPYKSVNPFSKAIGYAEGSTIYVNTRKLYLPYFDRVENIIHETMHLCGYSHDGNRVNQYNLRTVPYLVAALFKNYIQEIYG